MSGQMKNLNDLISKKSFWGAIEELLREATNQYEILPKNQTQADKALVALQAGVDTPMGAIVYETGGILVNNGWLRILGSGHDRLKRSIAEWNLGKSYGEIGDEPEFLMVADDIIGGLFAMNCGMLGDDIGSMYYLAPDTIEWEPLDVDYMEFLGFCLKGHVDEFYSMCRWNGWQEGIKSLSGDETILFNPPLWEDGATDINERERHTVSADEAFAYFAEVSELLADEEYDDEDYEGDDDDCGCGHDHHHGHHHDDGCDCDDCDDDDCEDGCGCCSCEDDDDEEEDNDKN